jgi:inosine/xanthosine triphosphate pyrophosphatase family protein
MELIIATGNKGKVREYRDIFEPLGFQVFSQKEKNLDLDVEETGTTFDVTMNSFGDYWTTMATATSRIGSLSTSIIDITTDRRCFF